MDTNEGSPPHGEIETPPIATQDSSPLNVAVSTIPFSPAANNLIIPGKIEGKHLSFLIDTGANVCALSSNLWKSLPELSKHPTEPLDTPGIQSVSGELLLAEGRAMIPFEIESKVYQFPALIVKGLNFDVILGKDFLENFQSTIDLGAHQIHLADEGWPFSHMEPTAEPPASFLQVQEKTTLPPKSESIIPVKLSQPLPIGMDRFTEPRAKLPERY